jgi:hypothetical protein
MAARPGGIVSVTVVIIMTRVAVTVTVTGYLFDCERGDCTGFRGPAKNVFQEVFTLTGALSCRRHKVRPCINH